MGIPSSRIPQFETEILDSQEISAFSFTPDGMTDPLNSYVVLYAKKDSNKFEKYESLEGPELANLHEWPKLVQKQSMIKFK